MSPALDHDGLTAVLEAAGWRCTPQRLAVYEHLSRSAHHPTAEEVHRGVRAAIPKISLSYFGTDTPQRYGIAYTWLPSYHLENPNPRIFELAPGGWLAISATNLQGVYFVNKRLFASLKNHTPEAMIGYSIFVYHFDDSTPMPLKQTPP